MRTINNKKHMYLIELGKYDRAICAFCQTPKKPGDKVFASAIAIAAGAVICPSCLKEVEVAK